MKNAKNRDSRVKITSRLGSIEKTYVHKHIQKMCESNKRRALKCFPRTINREIIKNCKGGEYTTLGVRPLNADPNAGDHAHTENTAAAENQIEFY